MWSLVYLWINTSCRHTHICHTNKQFLYRIFTALHSSDTSTGRKHVRYPQTCLHTFLPYTIKHARNNSIYDLIVHGLPQQTLEPDGHSDRGRRRWKTVTNQRQLFLLSLYPPWANNKDLFECKKLKQVFSFFCVRGRFGDAWRRC